MAALARAMIHVVTAGEMEERVRSLESVFVDSRSALVPTR
jgi:hypothetical protein